jgi:hypothetical protein
MPSIQTIENNSDWMRVQQGMQYARVSRSRLYAMIRDHDIKSCSIKRRGRKKGMRFISKSSIDAFLDGQCNSQTKISL